MSNNKYCKFGDTHHQLKKCVDAMENVSRFSYLELDEHEEKAFHKMQLLCQTFIEKYEYLTN